MKYIKSYETYEYIHNDVEDIFADISDIGLRVIKQLQENYMVFYICGPAGDNTIYYLTDIKKEVNHFISQMEEYGHELVSARYRLLHKGTFRWITLWDGIGHHATKKVAPTDAIFDVQDNNFDTMKVDSFELKFTK